MEIDGWFSGYKVRSFPWIDGKLIYFNVQYFAPGQSICKPPVWGKTVYITNNPAGQRIVHDFTDSLTQYVARMKIPENSDKVVITA